MNVRNVIIIVVILCLILVVAITLVNSLTHVEKEDPIFTNPVNTKIYAVLAEAGFDDSIVDSTTDRTIVIIPITADVNRESAAYYAMGVVSTVSPETKKIIVQLYINQSLSSEYIAGTQDVITYSKAGITDEEFESRVKQS